MKKVILSLAVCAMAAAANAQTAGSILLYGNVGYTSQKDERTQSFGGGPSVTSTDKESSFFINPGIGYCITNNLAVGLNVNFTSDKNESPSGTNTQTIKSNSLLVGPFVRYTKMLGEHFFIYGQLQVGYLHGSEKTETTGSTITPETKYNGVAGALYPAVGIRLTPCVSLTGAFGGVSYDHRTYDNYVPAGVNATDQTKSNDFRINLGQEFMLGVQFNLGGHMHHGHHEMNDDTRNGGTHDDDEDTDTSSKKKKSRKDDDE